MTSSHNLRYQEGAILVLALIMLLVMTTMGIGLWYAADREAKQVAITVDRSETLYSAESCIDEAARWLDAEAIKSPPCKLVGTGKVCKTIPDSGANPSLDDPEWRTPAEKTPQRTRMASHTYTCNIMLVTSIAVVGQQNTGLDVGQTNTYGGSTSSTKKYIYKITSKGFGPDNVRSDVEVIASIISSL